MKKTLICFQAALIVAGCANQTDFDAYRHDFDEVAKEVKAQFAPDRRERVFEPQLVLAADSSTLLLKGVTTEGEAKRSLVDLLAQKGIEVADSMIVLPDPSLGDKVYGITNQSVINFNYGPGFSYESATQTMMGAPVRILERRSGWFRAVTPEGYIAWVTAGSIAPMTQAEYDDWSSSKRLVITTHYTLLRSEANSWSDVVIDGVMGNIVKYISTTGGYYKVALPDGREAYLAKGDATDFEGWVDSRNPTPQNLTATAKLFVGFPYMWGGTSIKAVDCSGFVKSVYFLNGVILERDASQQALTGEDVDISAGYDNLEMGDLLFFGTKAKQGKKERITHVGMYIKDGEFIHSSTSVKINSLLKDSPIYSDVEERLVRAKRVITMIDKDPGIVSVKSHPWYFVK